MCFDVEPKMIVCVAAAEQQPKRPNEHNIDNTPHSHTKQPTMHRHKHGRQNTFSVSLSPALRFCLWMAVCVVKVCVPTVVMVATKHKHVHWEQNNGFEFVLY